MGSELAKNSTTNETIFTREELKVLKRELLAAAPTELTAFAQTYLAEQRLRDKIAGTTTHLADLLVKEPELAALDRASAETKIAGESLYGVLEPIITGKGLILLKKYPLSDEEALQKNRFVGDRVYTHVLRDFVKKYEKAHPLLTVEDDGRDRERFQDGATVAKTS